MLVSNILSAPEGISGIFGIIVLIAILPTSSVLPKLF
ncbi:MAG: hypothetical protein CMD16_02380 [Flavobacteriales bacterium]|nr:hypothetical protein [Flavobacteriales bacterium]